MSAPHGNVNKAFVFLHTNPSSHHEESTDEGYGARVGENDHESGDLLQDVIAVELIHDLAELVDEVWCHQTAGVGAVV